MASDALILAGIEFDSYSTPRRMGAGGAQAMVVHKLPGGRRVIDTLGPDEDNITWDGQFFGEDAYATAMALDAIRAAGQVVPLIFGGQSRSVIIDRFGYRIARMPNWVEYNVSCMVAQNPSLGDLSSGSPSAMDDLVSGDLGTAATAASPAGSSLVGNDFSGSSGLA